MPWLPQWPGLASHPSYDPEDFPWVADLRYAYPEILAEMRNVRADFSPAVADFGVDPGPRQAYYFYL